MAENIYGTLMQKLDLIVDRQSELAVNVARMDERQALIHKRLTFGDTKIADHDDRIESLEKSRDKAKTAIGMLVAAWTGLVSFGTWLYNNFTFRWHN